MAPLNFLDDWAPGCWCIATLQLCERFTREELDGPARYPAQWAYFVWEPRDNALPHAMPSGWGLPLNKPEPDLAEVIDGAPVYALKEFEADWPTLLDILLECDQSPPWLEDLIIDLRKKAARRRREHWMTRYGDDRPAFEAFIRKLLNDTIPHLKEA